MILELGQSGSVSYTRKHLLSRLGTPIQVMHVLGLHYTIVLIKRNLDTLDTSIKLQKGLRETHPNPL